MSELRWRLAAVGFSAITIRGSGHVSSMLGEHSPLRTVYGSYLAYASKWRPEWAVFWCERHAGGFDGAAHVGVSGDDGEGLIFNSWRTGNSRVGVAVAI